MIFRLSTKLATKLKAAPLLSLPLADVPLNDWSGHLFAVHRVHYLIIANTASLYSTILVGRGIVDCQGFAEAAVSAIRETLQADGLGHIAARVELPDESVIQFSKALNRSIVASVNDLVYHAKFWIGERQATLTHTCNNLNDMPLGTFDFQSARQMIGKLMNGPK